MPERRRVFVVSAPSGAGKTTLNRMLINKHENIEIAVSLTTRAKREAEVDGRDYRFVTQEEFERHIKNDDMLEWANVHGNLYGTSKEQLRLIEQRSHFSLLEIDVQGWLQAREKLKRATSIFILPPSIVALWERLETRGTDDLKVRWQRLCNAEEEIRNAKHYDYFIVNEDLKRAYNELESIVIGGQAGKIGAAQGLEMCTKLLDEFATEPMLLELKSKFH